ncbi:gluconate 2-dehydrogenase subunit 3 family protein [Halalkalibacter okhensis]|uniref:gluconate 2-dehydrogenase subunit 3 family protein n=1 Tax=Halalkalibacter okhensis TaxID=333138 RepID=UPI000690F5F3|nr:gluconate 2-dehydrogenase subunit 3 family protein [Halalkalibacter okhensis]
MAKKKMRAAYIRSRPLDGRAQICYTEKEWDELIRHQRAGCQVPEFKKEFIPILLEAVNTIFPGAKQAGVARFILQSLKADNRQDLTTYEEGLDTLKQLSKKKYGKSFKKLSKKKRTAILQELEGTEFFDLLREHTMQGMFADPKYGGNHKMIGWKIIDYPGSRFHPITHTSKNWETDDIVSLRGDVRKNNGQKN